VGTLVPFFLELTDPITGEIVDDALVTYSVTHQLEDGTFEFVAFGVVPFDAEAGGYGFEFDTTGLEPGIYDVYLGISDGRSIYYQIEVTE
jgi:hypothetical protein